MTRPGLAGRGRAKGRAACRRVCLDGQTLGSEACCQGYHEAEAQHSGRNRRKWCGQLGLYAPTLSGGLAWRPPFMTRAALTMGTSWSSIMKTTSPLPSCTCCALHLRGLYLQLHSIFCWHIVISCQLGVTRQCRNMLAILFVLESSSWALGHLVHGRYLKFCKWGQHARDWRKIWSGVRLLLRWWNWEGVLGR